MFVFVLQYSLNNLNSIHSLTAVTVVVTMEKMVFSHKHKTRMRNKHIHQEFGLENTAT